MRTRWMVGGAVVGSVLVGVAVPAGGEEAPEAPAYEVVASGLDNPRGLAFAADGTLYVAESGKGGNRGCIDGPEGEACLGFSGAVTMVRNGRQSRLIQFLPSYAAPDGTAATGPVDVAPEANGSVLVAMSGVGTAANRASLPRLASFFGRLLTVSSSGRRVGAIADPMRHEQRNNPHPEEEDSNLNSIAIAGGTVVFADAGGNYVGSIAAGGRGAISTVTVFEDRMVDAPAFLELPAGTKIPMQSVPDSVAVGPDGSVYVGELTGFPFESGAARVIKVDATGKQTVVATGFTNIMDIAVASDGTIYVLQAVTTSLLDENPSDGLLVKVAPDGTTTTIAKEGLVFPGGIAIGPDGDLYVSNFSILPGLGQVIRIPQ